MSSQRRMPSWLGAEESHMPMWFRRPGSSREAEICTLGLVTTAVLGIAAGKAEAQCIPANPGLVLSASAGTDLSIFNRGPQGDCFTSIGPAPLGATASVVAGCDFTYTN